LRFNQLWQKLAFSFILVTLIAVLAAYFLINFAIEKGFKGYFSEKEQLQYQKIGESIALLYRDKAGFSAQLAMAVQHFSMMNEVDIQVVDTNGRIIAQSPSLISSLDSHMPMMQEHMGKLPGSSLIETQKLVLGKTTEVPVFAHNKKVATVLVTPLVKPGELDEDQRFKASINSALVLGGLVATLVALGLSFFISTRMTKPLSLMTVSAKKMEQGDLSQRIEVKGQDEISQLGEAFNHLSMALARQENLRKNLTADIAHELRTPLTTLRTHLEAVLDGVMPPSKENLQSMHEEILRLTRLVDDLGKLAEAESGALKLNLNEEDIHTLIKKVTANMQPLFQEKGVKLVTELNAGQSRLKIDKDKVQQVLLNLLSNALKFTPSGGEVKVTTATAADKLIISVKDTGIGISKKEQGLIFERFYRVDKSRSRATGGSGIGLTVAKEMVRMHGGDIKVKSRLGEGSEFSVILPLKQRVI